MCVNTDMHVYTYIYICGRRERERERERESVRASKVPIEASYNLTLLKGPCSEAITRDVEPNALDLQVRI